MQFVNQLKTVLIVGIGFALFPVDHTVLSVSLLVVGLACALSGVAYYTSLKQAAAKAGTPVSTTVSK
jgi:hypothetical protein